MNFLKNIISIMAAFLKFYASISQIYERRCSMNKERFGLWVTAIFAALQSLYEIFSKLF